MRRSVSASVPFESLPLGGDLLLLLAGAQLGDVFGQAFGRDSAEPADWYGFDFAAHDKAVHESSADAEHSCGFGDRQQDRVGRWLRNRGGHWCSSRNVGRVERGLSGTVGAV